VLGHSEGAIIAPMVAEKEPTSGSLYCSPAFAEPGRTARHFQPKNIIRADVLTMIGISSRRGFGDVLT
jgi:hypothetical protein